MRTHEIGIRVALGAGRGDILGMIAGQGAKLAALGLTMGLGEVWAATRALKSMLFQVTPTDPWTFSAVQSYCSWLRWRLACCPRAGLPGSIRLLHYARNKPADHGGPDRLMGRSL
jgi:hypothetical protein